MTISANLILAESRLLKLSFERFVAGAWPELEGSEFIPAQHVGLLARHLQAAARGDIKRLLINIPPECSKSTLVSVMFPAWVWTWWPDARFMYQSYLIDFALRDAATSRRLIESTWYRSRWPDVVLEEDDNKKSFYKTTRGGYRLSTSRGSRATGEHPDFIVFEDPLSVEQASNKLEREAWKTWYSDTISSRGVSRDVCHILSQQRLHPDDPSSVALEENAQACKAGEPIPWHHVCLPMRYEPERAMPDRGYGGDWRSTEGELLFPQMFSDQKVRATERRMGPRTSRAQLQQDPQHNVGQMFNVERLLQNRISADQLPKLERIVRFWDRAATEGGGCYTAGVLLGIHRDRRAEHPRIFILDVVRGQWNPDQVLGQMASCCLMDELRIGGVEKSETVIEQEPGSGGKESAENAVRRLRGHRVRATRPTGNKVARAEPLANAIALGEVFIVDSAWTADFIAELRDFPAGKYKDQVDAAGGAYLELVNPSREKPVIIAGLNLNRDDLCAAPGCGRPVEPDKDYCCSCCEITAAFNDPEMQVEHSPECAQRNFDYSQEHTDHSDPRSSMPHRGAGGLMSWRY